MSTQKTSHIWFAIAWHTWTHFDIFGTNVADKVSNQKTPYCATSNNVRFCTTWQNGETRKSHFSLRCYQCIARIQLPVVAPWFLQSFWLMTDNQVAVWLLNLVIHAFSSGLLVGHDSGERKSREPQQLDCVACTMHVHQWAVFLKEKKTCKLSLWCVW